jgi:16S rRNA (cytosine1402-N4)-methyltransferase
MAKDGRSATGEGVPTGAAPVVQMAAGMTHDPRHRPVVLAEVVGALAPADGETVVDGTFGLGGYSRAILVSGARVIGIDRDPLAVAAGEALALRNRRFTMVHGRFGDLAEHLARLGIDAVDGVVLDIGVSSVQLDEAERGFSFRFDGPLDMRMSGEGPSAADIVNGASEAELADIFHFFGEERRARAMARAIVTDRVETPFIRTRALAELAERVIGRGRDDIHPATRVFQALRIAVNGELDELARALVAAEAVLRPGGRLVVVTFHSLEDRMVKHFLADRAASGGGSRHAPAQSVATPTFRLLTRGVVTAGAEEIAANPRARSAKLRAAVRLDAPARDALPMVPGADRHPDRSRRGRR